MPEQSTPCRPQGHCQLTGVKSGDRLLDRVTQTVKCDPYMSELFQIIRHDRNKHDLQIVWNFAAFIDPKYYCVHKSTFLVFIFSQMNPLNALMLFL
jgi:hypothetical protein